MQAYEITVDGCASGLGLGLDSVNRVTILKPGGPADACGLIAVGDRIVNVDGEPLGGLPVQEEEEQQPVELPQWEAVGSSGK